MSITGGPWHPPVPSLAALPVDRTKTEPKPAYYKLQFGDDYTGFSYYVRTLGVVIGRNVVSHLFHQSFNEFAHGFQEKIPPPDISEQSVPTNPPLGSGLGYEEEDERRLTPPLLDDVQMQEILDMDISGIMGELSGHLDLPIQPLEQVQERAQTTPPMIPTVNGITADIPPFQASSAPPELPDFVKTEPESYFDPIFAPPPPPIRSGAGPVDHVDVDLGPLKSVSRNHARIQYRNELGHFCLEITGRNGAWVDDRYYVKGSTVPLNQG